MHSYNNDNSRGDNDNNKDINTIQLFSWAFEDGDINGNYPEIVLETAHILSKVLSVRSFFSFSRLVCLDHRLWCAPDSSRYSGVLETMIIIITMMLAEQTLSMIILNII